MRSHKFKNHRKRAKEQPASQPTRRPAAKSGGKETHGSPICHQTSRERERERKRERADAFAEIQNCSRLVTQLIALPCKITSPCYQSELHRIRTVGNCDNTSRNPRAPENFRATTQQRTTEQRTASHDICIMINFWRPRIFFKADHVPHAHKCKGHLLRLLLLHVFSCTY